VPLYEYQCSRCGGVTTYYERTRRWRLLGRKCGHCGSRRTRKVLSTFSVRTRRTETEVLNELKHLGPVSFAESPHRACPYGPHPDESQDSS